MKRKQNKKNKRKTGERNPTALFIFAMEKRRSTYLGGVISFRLNEIGVVPIIEHPTAKDKKTLGLAIDSCLRTRTF